MRLHCGLGWRMAPPGRIIFLYVWNGVIFQLPFGAGAVLWVGVKCMFIIGRLPGVAG